MAGVPFGFAYQPRLVASSGCAYVEDSADVVEAQDAEVRLACMARLCARPGLIRIGGDPKRAPKPLVAGSAERCTDGRVRTGLLEAARAGELQPPQPAAGTGPACGSTIAAASCRREPISSLRYAFERCTSTVFTVTKSACAMSLLLSSSAA